MHLDSRNDGMISSHKHKAAGGNLVDALGADVPRSVAGELRWKREPNIKFELVVVLEDPASELQV